MWVAVTAPVMLENEVEFQYQPCGKLKRRYVLTLLPGLRRGYVRVGM